MTSRTGRTIQYGVLALAAVVAACTSDRPTAPAVPLEGAIGSALSPTSDCSVSTLSAYAKTYFGSASNIASNDIKALSDACKAYVGAKGDTAKQRVAQDSANAAGFRVFRDIASVAGARSAYASAGASLTVATLPFMSIGGDASLQSALTLALSPYGIYGVGSSSAYKTIFARNDGDRWGILAHWNTDVLVYGYPIADATSGLPSASYKGAYDVSTLPASTTTSKPYAPPYSIGVCFRDGTTSVMRDVPNTVRVQHTSNPEFLEINEDLCKPDYAMKEDPSFGSRLLAYAGRAVDLFVPQDLWAPTKTGVGGFGSDLSPFYTPDLGGLVASYEQQPASGTVTSGIVPPIMVKVVTANRSIRVPGTIVVLSVANNSGSPAGAYLSWVDTTHANDCPPGIDPTTSVCTLVNPDDGIATFQGVKTNKPGGYTLSALGYFNGIFSPAVNSNLFQVQQ